MPLPSKNSRLVSLMLVGLGTLVLAGVAMFLFRTWRVGGTIDGNVITLLFAGLAALVCGELLPFVQSIKIGDKFSIDFRDINQEITTELLTLKSRVTALEVKAETAMRPPALQPIKPAPPELDKRGPYKNDPRKGQFGKDVGGGLRLRAEFPGPVDRDWTTVRLIVEPETKGADMSDVRLVEFFLHDTFDKPRVKAPVKGDSAELRLTVWGGFTVGVWVPDRDVALELDLALLPDVPAIIRDL